MRLASLYLPFLYDRRYASLYKGFRARAAVSGKELGMVGMVVVVIERGPLRQVDHVVPENDREHRALLMGP
jgi:hypothetical protein